MSVADTTAAVAKAAHGVTLSDAAAAKAKELLDRDGTAEMVLRIAERLGFAEQLTAAASA